LGERRYRLFQDALGFMELPASAKLAGLPYEEGRALRVNRRTPRRE
jgi:hypothetical protein